MHAFACPTCAQLVFFHNSRCLACDTALGYDPSARTLVGLRRRGATLETVPTGRRVRACANAAVAACNWLVDDHERPGGDGPTLCRSCRLTSVRPGDGDGRGLAQFARAEAAKRRLLHELAALGLDVTDGAAGRPAPGFRFLSSAGEPVVTGHDDGMITLDLAESDDAHREIVRTALGEPYRTVLGHLRHEIGHWWWPHLVVASGRLDAFRACFGDERTPYDDALRAHYGGRGGDPGDDHVSGYAAAHPWEDWAETFAHYLLLRDGVATARSFGLRAADPSAAAGRRAVAPDDAPGAGALVAEWLGLVVALNAMGRSLGHGDLYPFVLAPGVVAKLEFVHGCVEAAAATPAAR